jgi:hypothetical protein
LVFEAIIVPSGSVTNIRLVKGIDPEYPWPTIAERTQSSIAEWRYDPVTVSGKPVAVCMTIAITVHVM